MGRNKKNIASHHISIDYEMIAYVWPHNSVMKLNGSHLVLECGGESTGKISEVVVFPQNVSQ